MNKKVLVIALAFVFLALLATPLISAKPTSAANNSKAVSFMWHSENGEQVPIEGGIKTNPPWAEGGDVKVTHSISSWNLVDIFNNYVQIGEEDPIKIYDAGYEAELHVQVVATSPTSAALNYRVYETIMWDDNYIEIMCLERASYDENGFYASGTFNGHGVVDGQKVQVTGIREGFVDPSIGFVLECYGTIRFAGNTP